MIGRATLSLYILKIFISYSHIDRDDCSQIAQFLGKYHEVWWDKEDIRPGSDWSDAINRGIRNCDVFLFLASRNSAVSPYCALEVKTAIQHKKVIIPVMRENIILPPELAKLQWVFMDDFEVAMCELLGSLSSHPSRVWQWQVLCMVEAILLVAAMVF